MNEHLPSSVYFQIDNFAVLSRNEINAGDFTAFGIAAGQLEIALKCWSLQRNAEDLATMYHHLH